MAMSQSIILNNLKQQELSENITTAMLSSLENDNKMQDNLSQIANQATNFGYGSGVALRAAIERLKIFCKNFEKSPGIFNSLFYDNLLVGVFIEAERSDRNQRLKEQCHESVSELEKIENEITNSRCPR